MKELNPVSIRNGWEGGFSTKSGLSVLIVLLLSTIAYLWLYRIYLHPLSIFPGPRRAAMSRSWVYQQKRQPFPEHIYNVLHKQYKTRALRIGPNELHLSDVSLYKTIYNQTTPYLKDKRFYDGFLTAHTLFAEYDPQRHKERRKVLNPFFSRSGVMKLEPVIHQKIELLLSKINRISERGPIEVSYALRCITVDVISQFAFGRSRNLIDESPDTFNAALLNAIDASALQLAVMQHSRFLLFLTQRIPLSLIARFDKSIAQIHHLHTFARDSVVQHQERTQELPHPVIFDSLRALSTEDQAMEAVDILLAGSDTTAFTAATSLYLILSNDEIKKNLMSALKKAIPHQSQMPCLLEMEKIAYLWACTKESLRMAMPVPGQLPRVVPKNAAPLVVDDKIIPQGTIIGMSAYTMHTDTSLWGSDARMFNPDRWLGSNGKTLDQHLCTFSKGIRQCIGINVAHAEVTMLLAYLFRRFDMTLKTKELNIHDGFASFHKDGVYINFKQVSS